MKHFTLTLLFVLSFFTHCFSQEIEWQNTIGGDSADIFTSIQQTSDGGYILGGSSNSNLSGDKSENSLGDSDYWIIKTDALGNIQWQNTIGGDQGESFKCIQQTTDGGYILGGNSLSNISGDKTENCSGQFDYWIVKIDSLGNIQWQNTLGGNLTEVLTSLQQTSDGGYILGGYSNSNISGDKTENSKGLEDYWIVKINAFGVLEWENTIGGIDYDYFETIEQTSDGGYILGGWSSSNISGDKTEGNLGSLGTSDYWILKVDSSGNIQWQNTIGGNANDVLSSIFQTNDGGYIIGGYSSSDISSDKSENSLGIFDCWIVKTDQMGNIQWQNTIGGSLIEELVDIKENINGGYLIGGNSESNISSDKTENCIGNRDYWIVATDSVGNIQWQNTIGGSNYDYFTCLQLTADGGCVFGGYSTSNISGDKIENSLGKYDYWILKLTSKYNLITGQLFADFNSNSIQDSGEPPLLGKKIIEQNTGRFAFSDLSGNYSLSVLDTGSYSAFSQSLLWYSPIPALQSATFSGIILIDSLNDFAYQPQGSYDDVCVTITPLGRFRSGFNASYQINYGNYGTTTQAPTITFYPDNNVIFISATSNPSLVTPDSIVFSFSAMSPFQTGSFVITVSVNAGLPIGTLINSTVHIEPYANDANQSCNNSNWEVYTSGSFDPNEILVSDATLTPAELSTSPWLDYIINFQNTGNDTAFTVKILNPIDTNKLNLSTIEFVNASHPVNLSWINYQRNMEFKFDNILLPDSNTNEPLSHGFVRYRIQPKTNLSIGDTVSNFAAIYFDFNEPVITNTATTIIVVPTGLSSASNPGKLLVFPNPAANKINITGIKLENGKANLCVTDIYGKLIVEKTISSTTTDIEIQNLSSGLYLIQSGDLRATFVKQ